MGLCGIMAKGFDSTIFSNMLRFSNGSFIFLLHSFLISPIDTLSSAWRLSSATQANIAFSPEDSPSASTIELNNKPISTILLIFIVHPLVMMYQKSDNLITTLQQ